MKDHLIPFQHIDWESQSPGLRFKKCVYGKYQIRLVEFSNGFVESNWCKKEHTGLIIEGNCSIAFPDHSEEFKTGDVFILPNGDAHRHKLMLIDNKIVTVLLFELVGT